MHDTLQNALTSPAVDDGEVAVDRADLVSAWAVLENLAVSLDQLGTLDTEEELRHALRDYVTPDLVRALGRARGRLSSYLPDDETEAMAENDVPYWDYKGMAGGKYVGVAKGEKGEKGEQE